MPKPKVKQIGDKLTEKEQAWIDHYLACGNATEAARLAGYKGKNLHDIGHQNSAKLGMFINPRKEVVLAAVESSRIATIQETHEILTAIMRGYDEDAAARRDAISAINTYHKIMLDREKLDHEKARDEDKAPPQIIINHSIPRSLEEDDDEPDELGD